MEPVPTSPVQSMLSPILIAITDSKPLFLPMLTEPGQNDFFFAFESPKPVNDPTQWDESWFANYE